MSKARCFIKMKEASLVRVAFFVYADEIQIIAEGIRYLRIEGTMYAGIGILYRLDGFSISPDRAGRILQSVSLKWQVLLRLFHFVLRTCLKAEKSVRKN